MRVDIKDNGLNIKDLVIEGPTEKVGFDLEQLFSEDDWLDISEDMSDLNRDAGIATFLNSLARIKLLAPNRIPIFRLGQRLGRTKEMMAKSKGEKDIRFYLSIASPAKQLFEKRDLDLSIEEDFKRRLIGYTKRSDQSLEVYSPKNFKLLYPKEPVEVYTPKNYWQIARSEIQASREKGYWYWAAYYLASSRLLYPEKFLEYGIGQNDLQSIYQEAVKSRSEGYYFEAIELAWCLKILSADSVEVNDDGIQLINHHQFRAETQPLPEVRRF